MHNAALAETGLDYVYVAFHVPPEAAAAVGDSMRALEIAGLNVTVPHKQAVMAGLDEIADEAQAIGAVNTIANCGGRLTGHNTDAYGIVASLREDGGLDRLPAAVVLLGAGGAARAILYALLQAPEVEEVTLLNRTASRAVALAADLDPEGNRTRVGEAGDLEALARAGLLINATSVGMVPRADVSPLGDGAALHSGLVVYDTVYRPRRTLLMEQAEAAGARPVGGLGMLLHQGVRAFEIWTERPAPVSIMRRALEAAVGA